MEDPDFLLFLAAPSFLSRCSKILFKHLSEEILHIKTDLFQDCFICLVVGRGRCGTTVGKNDFNVIS